VHETRFETPYRVDPVDCGHLPENALSDVHSGVIRVAGFTVPLPAGGVYHG